MRKAEIYLEYQPLIAEPPVAPETLFKNACSNDDLTIAHWEHIWLGNTAANKSRFGSFGDHCIAQEFQKHKYKPAIIVGSGPSLKYNAHELKNRGQIPLVSCLHNFHFLEDLGTPADYYVTLDAGPITIDEVSEGGKKTPDEYWEISKDRTLIAYIATHPDLLAKWKGRILFFNGPLPDTKLIEKMDAIENYQANMPSGGNVLGACMYFSKAVLGCWEIVFIGADFSFGYDRKFHSWESRYDASLGRTVRMTDVFGNKVHTWPSYLGFKQYFDRTAIMVPGSYVNCTEGGILGAYDQGNLAHFKYMALKDYLINQNLSDQLADSLLNPINGGRKILYP